MHRAQAEAKAAAREASAVKVRARPLLPRGSVSVTVLNGSGVSGAAAAQASRVRARGYLVGDVGNAPRSGYGRSVVMYRAGRRPEALRWRATCASGSSHRSTAYARATCWARKWPSSSAVSSSNSLLQVLFCASSPRRICHGCSFFPFASNPTRSSNTSPRPFVQVTVCYLGH